MSYLPKYQSVPTDDVPYPPTSDKPGGHTTVPGVENEEDAPPLYPPRPAEAESSQRGGVTGPLTVTYSFEPRWPTGGERADAMDTLGQTKEEATTIVLRAFPHLREYPRERIELLVPVDTDAKDIRWAEIMEGAWAGLVVRPPANLRVQIADLPGDAQARKRRELRTVILVMLGIVSIMPIGMTIAWLLGGFEAKQHTSQ